MTISDVQDEEYDLIMSYEEIDSTLKDLGCKCDYDGLFLKIGDGEILEAYGFYGCVPALTKQLYIIKVP